MAEQLDLFSDNKEKCRHCGRHVPPHYCWRCGNVVDCTIGKLGGQKMSSKSSPGLIAIIGSGRRPGSSCYECFECNHAVALEQLAYAWHRRKGASFADALDRLHRRLNRVSQ